LTFPTEATEEAQRASALRDRTAAAQSLRPILAPRSIAIVGASARTATIGHALVTNVRGAGFRGAIYPVHPTAESIEGLAAFMLESTFLGVLVFGWDKVSRRVLWFSSLMVAVGATISAFWIIVANSWQQTPAGYHLVNGRAELADFWAAVFNPSSLERYFHTVDAAVMTGAFFVLGISAWFVLKGRHQRFAEESMRMALMVALVTSIAQVGFGHAHGVQVGRTQPEKLAAFEGLMETQRRAPALVFGIPDPEREIVHWDIGIPGLLSIFVYGNPNAEIKGLKAFPKDERPPVLLIFTTFHTMVGLGAYMILLALFGIHMMRCKTLCDNRIFLRLALWSIPVPFIANELGWVTAEVGRQPWIVYHLVKTQDAASPNVPAAHILASIIMFVVIYSVLFSLWFFLLRRIMEKGPEPYEAAAPAPVHPEVGT
jgi:cytochrome d ubiquinol oxidase subunit I